MEKDEIIPFLRGVVVLSLSLFLLVLGLLAGITVGRIVWLALNLLP